MNTDNLSVEIVEFSLIASGEVSERPEYDYLYFPLVHEQKERFAPTMFQPILVVARKKVAGSNVGRNVSKSNYFKPIKQIHKFPNQFPENSVGLSECDTEKLEAIVVSSTNKIYRVLAEELRRDSLGIWCVVTSKDRNGVFRFFKCEMLACGLTHNEVSRLMEKMVSCQLYRLDPLYNYDFATPQRKKNNSTVPQQNNSSLNDNPWKL